MSNLENNLMMFHAIMDAFQDSLPSDFNEPDFQFSSLDALQRGNDIACNHYDTRLAESDDITIAIFVQMARVLHFLPGEQNRYFRSLYLGAVKYLISRQLQETNITDQHFWGYVLSKELCHQWKPVCIQGCAAAECPITRYFSNNGKRNRMRDRAQGHVLLSYYTDEGGNVLIKW